MTVWEEILATFMNPIHSLSVSKFALALSLAFGLGSLSCSAQIQVESRVRAMNSMADGNYLVTLDGGKLMNVAIKDGKATCVKSSDSGLKGMQGGIQTIKSGVFLIRFQNGQGAMSQVWIFRENGTAGVRELPDSGELQSAVPVKGDSLTPPKKAP